MPGFQPHDTLGLDYVSQNFPTASDVRVDTEATTATEATLGGTPTPQRQAIPRIFVKADLLANYFNNIKKCWEPLLERLSFTVLSEESPLRGYGLAARANSPIHLNLSADFLVAVQDTVKMILDTQARRQQRGRGTKRADSNAAGGGASAAYGTSDARTETLEIAIDREVSTPLMAPEPRAAHAAAVAAHAAMGASFYVSQNIRTSNRGSDKGPWK